MPPLQLPLFTDLAPRCRPVLEEVLQERAKQHLKWGEQNHAPFTWLAILGEEVGEANKAALETHFEYPDADKDYSNYREELIQVAAVAVAMVESLDRNHNVAPSLGQKA